MGLTALIESGMEISAATELLMNVIWTLLGAILVYFMQAGFAMCEAGFTRAKNTGNILMKNMMDFVLGSLFFFIFGFAIMHGADWNGIIGSTGFFEPARLADVDGLFNGLPIGVYIIFHQIQSLFIVQRRNQHLYLSRIRTLDLGRRLAGRDGIP